MPIPNPEHGSDESSRTLAAIVFTDVVGFANHANRNEPRALAALRRDLEAMEEVCARTNGVVLKTMGDGMLLRFPSANQALLCALEIQRVLHEQSRRLDPRDVLWHRIGVHLGDVVTSGADILGDGVNVAARLQAEAKPGSIMLSRTVYDVVKGKVKLSAVYLGPRRLKGISEPVAVWEVPPLGRQEQEQRNGALAALNFPDASAAEIRGGRAGLFVAGSFVLVVLAGLLLYSGISRARQRIPEATAAGALRLNREHVAKAASDPSGGDPAKVESPDPIADPQLMDSLRPLFVRDDFQGMAQLVAASTYGPSARGQALADRYVKLGELMAWFDTQMNSVTGDRAVSIAADPISGQPEDVFRTSPGAVAIRTPTATTLVRVQNLSKGQIAAICEGLLGAPSGAAEGERGEIEKELVWLTEDAQRFGVP